MRIRVFAWGAGLAALACAAASVGLAVRYPDMSTAESAGYVARRVTTLLEERFLANTPYDAHEPVETELANVRQIALSIEPGLAALAPLPAALALRDMVYRKVPAQVQPEGLDYSILDRAVFLDLTDADYGAICGGMTLTYLTLLKAFGIEARYVGLFKDAVDASDPVVSHASVEAFIDGRWVALDPFFGFSVHFDGRRIGWEEARTHVLNGEDITFESDGFPLLPGRSVQEHPYPIAQIMRFMIFAPTTQRGQRTALQTLPPDWDGLIRYANGKQFDQGGSLTQGLVYVKLAR